MYLVLIVIKSQGTKMTTSETFCYFRNLVSVQARSRAGLVGPVSYSDWVGYHIYLWHGNSVCWHIKNL